jgi:hypothetical protein
MRRDWSLSINMGTIESILEGKQWNRVPIFKITPAAY